MNMKLGTCWLIWTSALAMLCDTAAAGPPQVDPDRLELAAPIRTWDEAIPLGNGLTGGLLWGAGNTINLSLDRGDLWDERRPAVPEQPGTGARRG